MKLSEVLSSKTAMINEDAGRFYFKRETPSDGAILSLEDNNPMIERLAKALGITSKQPVKIDKDLYGTYEKGLRLTLYTVVEMSSEEKTEHLYRLMKQMRQNAPT